jgi:hypothetical protein
LGAKVAEGPGKFTNKVKKKPEFEVDSEAVEF